MTTYKSTQKKTNCFKEQGEAMEEHKDPEPIDPSSITVPLIQIRTHWILTSSSVAPHIDFGKLFAIIISKLITSNHLLKISHLKMILFVPSVIFTTELDTQYTLASRSILMSYHHLENLVQ